MTCPWRIRKFSTKRSGAGGLCEFTPTSSRQIEIVLMEPAQRLPRAAKLLHLVEDQRDRLLHTPVWILLIAVARLHEAHRRADDKLPAARLLVAGGQRTLA